MDARAALKELSSLVGPSGHEGNVRAYIEMKFAELGATVRRDRMGNVIGHLAGEGNETRPRVMVAAHMDEIGIMITDIDERGFGRFCAIGGIDPRTMLGQEIVIHGKSEVFGIVGAKPPHLQSADERDRPIPLDELFIDFAMPAEAVAQTVRIGDVGAVKRSAFDLLGDRLAGKAMDNRASLAALLVCMEEWGALRPKADLYAVATLQEEVGLRGAVTSTFGIMPDVGLAIDVCHADMPGVSPDRVATMGKGPAICLGPNIHRNVFERLCEVAKHERIPHQIETSQGPTGTDAWAIQITQSGVATGLISIPLRYMHTSVETLSFDDVRLSGILLAHTIASIDERFVEGLACY